MFLIFYFNNKNNSSKVANKYEFIEIQGTGEEATFSYNELINFVDVAKIGFEKLFEI